MMLEEENGGSVDSNIAYIESFLFILFKMLSENLKYLSLAIFTFAYSSQIYKVLETKSVDSLSIVMNFLILVGISISLYQYIREKSVYGIVSSLIGVIYYIAILILIAYYI